MFVEVLQNFCEDPREVAEVRASEAKLKAQLTSAQKQAQGHELQVLSPLLLPQTLLSVPHASCCLMKCKCQPGSVTDG